MKIYNRYTRKLIIEVDDVKTDLKGLDLSFADLAGAILSGAILSGASLSDANLSGANLSYANLVDADLGNASLYFANLRGANLKGAKLKGARYNDNTKFFKDFDPEQHGMVKEKINLNGTISDFTIYDRVMKRYEMLRCDIRIGNKINFILRIKYCYYKLLNK